MSDHESSRDASHSNELKAGHAPAIKVGGMRVGASRHRQISQGDDKDRANSNDEASGQNTFGSSSDGQSGRDSQRDGHDSDDEQRSGAVSNRVAGQMVSGTFVSVQKAFPTEAVKHIHDKPGTHPRHEQHAHAKHDDQRFINQPRK